MKKIQSLTTKVAMAMAVLAIVIAPTIASATITSTLKVGSRGTQVSELQSFLGIGSDGIFGSMTKAAVVRFQAANGLGSDGIVGPMTRAAITNGGQQTNNGNAPTISSVYVNPSRNSASVVWGTNVPAQGIVYYSTSPLTTYERENSVDVSGFTALTDASARTSQNVSLTNLQAGTRYYYLIYTTGQNGDVSVTWPSTFMTTN